MMIIDFMARSRLYQVGNIRVRARKVLRCDFDIWLQDDTKKIRDTLKNIEQSLRMLQNYHVPKVIIVKQNKLKAIAGYHYKQDILFISDALFSKEN